MATLGLKEMGNSFGKVGKKVSLVGCLSLAFPISFKPKVTHRELNLWVAIAKFVWKMQKKVGYCEKWVEHHASFPPRRSVNAN